MRRIWTGMGSKGIAYEENMDGDGLKGDRI